MSRMRVGSTGKRPNYGYDRPDLAVRFTTVGVVLIGTSTFLFYSSISRDILALLAIGLSIGLFFLGFGLTFVYSKAGKIRQRDELLNMIPWRGDEAVLDVGCGPGLLLVGAAKKLVQGKVVGIDIWKKNVESSNTMETVLENASLEGVSDKVNVRDGDARKLAFDDASFDVVLSRAVLHHIKEKNERLGALDEMLRVLKPSGYLGLVVIDFWNLRDYMRRIRESGMVEMHTRPNRKPGRPAFGATTLLAKKPA